MKVKRSPRREDIRLARAPGGAAGVGSKSGRVLPGTRAGSEVLQCLERQTHERGALSQ